MPTFCRGAFGRSSFLFVNVRDLNSKQLHGFTCPNNRTRYVCKSYTANRIQRAATHFQTRTHDSFRDGASHWLVTLHICPEMLVHCSSLVFMIRRVVVEPACCAETTRHTRAKRGRRLTSRQGQLDSRDSRVVAITKQQLECCFCSCRIRFKQLSVVSATKNRVRGIRQRNLIKKKQ